MPIQGPEEPTVQMNLRVPERIRQDLMLQSRRTRSTMAAFIITAWDTYHSIPLLQERIEELQRLEAKKAKSQS